MEKEKYDNMKRTAEDSMRLIWRRKQQMDCTTCQEPSITEQTTNRRRSRFWIEEENILYLVCSDLT